MASAHGGSGQSRWKTERLVCTIPDMDTYFVFVLASRHHRHISIDVCVNLQHGVTQLRQRINRRLRRKRVFQKLVYVESVQGMEVAVHRERQMQRMSRDALVGLVESVNPGWDRISLKSLALSGFSSQRTGPPVRPPN